MTELTWTRKDGKSISIKEMSTQHIVNALELMRRKMILLGKELQDRTGTNGYSEQEVDRLFKKVVNNYIKELKNDMEI